MDLYMPGIDLSDDHTVANRIAAVTGEDTDKYSADEYEIPEYEDLEICDVDECYSE